MELAIIILCYVIAIVVGVVFLRPKKEEKRFVPSNDYDTLIQILDETIKREILHKNNLEYKLKDVRIIYNFQEDLEDITKRILSSFSSQFYEEMEYYHKRGYIIQYVSRNVQTFLLEYTKQNKIKTK